jgi:hypothetical protein
MGADCFVDVLHFPDDQAGNADVRAFLEETVSQAR